MIRLTAFQAEEVGGLLDVCADEVERVPWGRLVRDRWLVVSDPVDAADDLRYRADWMIDEGAKAGWSGVAGAVSLRKLAALIEAG